MTRVGQLREQARVLRVLAASFDIPSIREELQALSERCETLAASIEKTVKQNLSAPIDSSSKGPTRRTPC
jgi:hypothetical protein